jgi:uncharacterized membrane protein
MAKAQQSANGRASAKPGGPAAGTGKAARPAAAAGPGQPGRGAPARKPNTAQNGAAPRSGSSTRNGSPARNGSAARPGRAAQARDAVRNGDTAPVPPGAPPAPRWLIVATGVLALIGVALSVYLTITHLHPAALICSGTKHSIVNCAAVTQSAQSKIFGIFPVAELGLGFYVVMAVLCTPWAWRLRRTLRLGPVSIGDRELRWIRLAGIIAGMGFVLYLVFVELLQLKQICLYCTGVHITTFLLFALIVFDSVFRQAPANGAAPAVAKRTKG